MGVKEAGSSEAGSSEMGSSEAGSAKNGNIKVPNEHRKQTLPTTARPALSCWNLYLLRIKLLDITHKASRHGLPHARPRTGAVLRNISLDPKELGKSMINDQLYYKTNTLGLKECSVVMSFLFSILKCSFFYETASILDNILFL